MWRHASLKILLPRVLPEAFAMRLETVTPTLVSSCPLRNNNRTKARFSRNPVRNNLSNCQPNRNLCSDEKVKRVSPLDCKARSALTTTVSQNRSSGNGSRSYEKTHRTFTSCVVWLKCAFHYKHLH